ncbi:HK97 family phage prohead protease [Roseinatronobacter alkalisoli]|uniref:HK97 family phage prohead protease n=1 Tax=Roseinatronobacter alkalisoli TaxID=3028235 RepID=A0ABT5T8P3_9RHOB|nr:HK97 family phage prohead protease [Roseinatronobacter sp. HJB301]MDD7971329.1 HK97 family phage prohead protease [Roseinatronobacter sp. HJB301]
MEYKFCKPEAGLTLLEGHRIAGYASVFGRRDKGGDTVLPGAYGASLQKLAARGDKVRMLWQHDPAQPIGIWDEVSEDAHGLFVKGRLLPDVARAREALALLQAGALDGLSIGYRTVRAQALATGGRNLVELDLWEVSLVTFPMQTEARISAKSDLLAGLRHATASMRDAREAVARL